MFKDDEGNWTCQFCGYNSKGRFHLIHSNIVGSIFPRDWIKFNSIKTVDFKTCIVN